MGASIWGHTDDAETASPADATSAGERKNTRNEKSKSAIIHHMSKQIQSVDLEMA